jgi:phosphohistidine phosphatase SixA
MFVAAVILMLAVPAAAQQTVFLVRHAERADAGAAKQETDPDLSSIGHARAKSLAAVLRDAQITAIFSTPLKRTQQTAEPLAKALGLKVTTVDAKDVDGLVKQIRAAKGNALIVGHSNTVPEAIKALGVATAVKIGDNDFDNLYLVSGTTLTRLHYSGQ